MARGMHFQSLLKHAQGSRAVLLSPRWNQSATRAIFSGKTAAKGHSVAFYWSGSHSVQIAALRLRDPQWRTDQAAICDSTGLAHHHVQFCVRQRMRCCRNYYWSQTGELLYFREMSARHIHIEFSIDRWLRYNNNNNIVNSLYFVNNFGFVLSLPRRLVSAIIIE